MSILDHAPAFSLDDAVQLAQTLYNLNVSAKSLPSERDQNFLLQTEAGKRFVLKIANGTEKRAMLEAQNQVMGYLAKHISFCPHIVQTANGEEITIVKSQDGKTHFIRLVTYLPGTPLGNVKRHSNELLYDLGYKIGQLTNALAWLRSACPAPRFPLGFGQWTGNRPQEMKTYPGSKHFAKPFSSLLPISNNTLLPCCPPYPRASSTTMPTTTT